MCKTGIPKVTLKLQIYFLGQNSSCETRPQGERGHRVRVQPLLRRLQRSHKQHGQLKFLYLTLTRSKLSVAFVI